MSDGSHFDLVVIGSGPAGHKAAIQGAKIGKRVLLVERGKTVGGECVQRGTIPSKSLRATAVQLAGLRKRLDGIADVELSGDVRVTSLMTRLHEVIEAHEGYLSRQLERNGVEEEHGRARFLSPTEIQIEAVGGRRRVVSSDRVVIAVGSRPRSPENVPIDHEYVLDSDSWLGLNYLPRTLIVLGSGVIACEYAATFASLGSHVTLLDKWPRPLGFLDEPLSRSFVEHFESWPGCEFVGGVQYSRIEWNGFSKVVVDLEDGRRLESDKLLCALGRVANVRELGVEAIGLELTRAGHVRVDEFGRTNVPGVYAAGDVIGPPSLASTSMDQGRRAVRHAFGLPMGTAIEMIPSGLYTIPEISTIGLTEQQAIERHGGAICGEARFEELARAHIDGNAHGALWLVADPDGRKLLGAHIFGEGATELIHVAQMALVANLDVDVFIETIFNFPTLSEAYRVAALDIVRKRECVVAGLP